mgnify:CR=1 FL=1
MELIPLIIVLVKKNRHKLYRFCDKLFVGKIGVISKTPTSYFISCVGDFVKYFAYGSNMSLLRLQERVPSAQRIGVFLLKAHQLRFHMASEDGSGKCDAYKTNNEEDVVIGALFEMNANEKVYLDKAESVGYGYEEKIVKVHNKSGEVFNALIYIAMRVDPSLKPYYWYLNHVVTGAIEINISAQYLNVIQSTACIDDPDKNRDTKQRAIYSW